MGGVTWKMSETLRKYKILGRSNIQMVRAGEGSISRHFTKFNSRTVNGPFFFLFSFLSGTGINQEVSGGHWIWVVVLFTDDWLASQNHQIHLPTVTFITVIFKVTATCLVSQRWPPRVHSHLLPFPPFPSSSFILSLFSTPHCCPPPHLASPCTYSPLLLHLTTFVWLSICPRVLPHSAGQFEGSRVREVWREAERRGEKRTK